MSASRRRRSRSGLRRRRRATSARSPVSSATSRWARSSSASRRRRPRAPAAGAYVPHRFCRRDGTPTNSSVPEDEATCVSLLNAAKAGLIKQRARAQTLLAGPKGPVRDFRYFFAKVYSYVTENEIEFVEKAAYLYPSYVLRSVLYFEKIYEDNFNAWDKQKAGASSV